MKYIRIFIISIIITSLLELFISATSGIYWFPAPGGNLNPRGFMAILIAFILPVSLMLTFPATWIVYIILNLLGVSMDARSPMIVMPGVVLLTSGICTLLIYGIDSLRKFPVKSGEYLGTTRDTPREKILSASFLIWSLCGVLWLAAVMIVFDLYFYKGGLLSYKMEFKDYYENGRIRIEGIYVDGEVTGKAVLYYESGKINLEQSFKNGNQNGPFLYFFKNGNKGSELNFINSKLAGTARYYYANGQIRMEGIYVDDKLEGPVVTYYESGKLFTKRIYKNGKMDGPSLIRPD